MVMRERAPKEIGILEFIRKIVKAESWDFSWHKSEARVLLKVYDDETVYVTPDLRALCENDFKWFCSSMDEIIAMRHKEEQCKRRRNRRR
jgi:hypothetical protein